MASAETSNRLAEQAFASIADLSNAKYLRLNTVDSGAELASMTAEDQAIALVFDYVKEHLDPSDRPVPEIDVYVVQFTYILGCWKALVSTSLPDGMYYEVTYDVRKSVAYLDPYKRFDHKEIAIPVPGR